MVVPPGVAPLPVSTAMVPRRNSPVATRCTGVQTGREQVLPVWLALCVVCIYCMHRGKVEAACGTSLHTHRMDGCVYIGCTYYMVIF